MMFEDGEDNFITWTQEAATDGLSDEVDSFGCTAEEDDFGWQVSSEKLLDALAGIFPGIGAASCQSVCTAMNIGVVVQVEPGNCVDDAAWFLGGGGVIEPDEWLTVNFLLQNREVGFDLQRLENADLCVLFGCLSSGLVQSVGDAVKSWRQQSCLVVVLQTVQLTDETCYSGFGWSGSGWCGWTVVSRERRK